MPTAVNSPSGEKRWNILDLGVAPSRWIYDATADQPNRRTAICRLSAAPQTYPLLWIRWGSNAFHTITKQDRKNGTLEPMWNLFDLTREGRGVEWNEQFSYSCCAER